jgi:hypothetical protein
MKSRGTAGSSSLLAKPTPLNINSGSDRFAMFNKQAGHRPFSSLCPVRLRPYQRGNRSCPACAPSDDRAGPRCANAVAHMPLLPSSRPASRSRPPGSRSKDADTSAERNNWSFNGFELVAGQEIGDEPAVAKNWIAEGAATLARLYQHYRERDGHGAPRLPEREAMALGRDGDALDRMYCSPVLRHPAGLIQAANFRSAIAF